MGSKKCFGSIWGISTILRIISMLFYSVLAGVFKLLALLCSPVKRIFLMIWATQNYAAFGRIFSSARRAQIRSSSP